MVARFALVRERAVTRTLLRPGAAGRPRRAAQKNGA
jgi:hypothetical protein